MSDAEGTTPGRLPRGVNRLRKVAANILINTRLGVLRDRGIGAADDGRVRDAGAAGPKGFVPSPEAWAALAPTGTIIVDPAAHYLYYVQPGGRVVPTAAAWSSIG